MPIRSNKLCSYRGCATSIPGDQDRCANHTRIPFEHVKGLNTKFYQSATWRNCRRSYLMANPMCEICFQRYAEVVDHIKAILDGGERFDWANLQGACHSCHNAKSAKEGHERRKL